MLDLSCVEAGRYSEIDLPIARRIGDYIPPGTQPLQDAWVGSGVQPLQLVVLAGFAAIGTALAAKLFRW